ncbi:hypothetical protein H8D91_01350 [archaeon]|nr:hypothetical protein [archaeon]
MVKDKLGKVLRGTVLTGILLTQGCVGYRMMPDGQKRQRSLEIKEEPTTIEQRSFPQPFYELKEDKDYSLNPFR